MTIGRSLKNLAAAIKESIENNTQYIEPRIMFISIIAVIGFPLYYFIWHDLFPQPYENLGLRLVGSGLFLPFMFVKHWPSWLCKYKAVYWFLTVLYALPFFFSFMLLMNAASTVWLMSALVATFLMVLLLSWQNLVIQFVIGTSLAWLAFSLATPQAYTPTHYWIYLPIFIFAIVAGGLLNFSFKMVQQERLRAMLAATSNIAHELRTPLLGIKSGAAGLQKYLPTLLATYQLAKNRGLVDDPIRLAHLHTMDGVLERIENEADQSNIIIDMLLMNARMDGYSTENFTTCSMARCIETALQRYPFVSEQERKLVDWDAEGQDFTFAGSELLMVHVLFNLLKNAQYYIARAGKGDINIRLEATPQGNSLIFWDGGTGIPPEVLPHIFTRFYSWSPDDNRSGAGIGLAFCRSVMHAFGGSIRCDSLLEKYTEFVLTFPASSGDKL